jgi:hypothetical protein
MGLLDYGIVDIVKLEIVEHLGEKCLLRFLMAVVQRSFSSQSVLEACFLSVKLRPERLQNFLDLVSIAAQVTRCLLAKKVRC